MTAPSKNSRTGAELVALGLIETDAQTAVDAVAEQYTVAISDAIIDRINPADPHDPVALQFVPSAKELVQAAHERTDPIGDQAHTPITGLVHRYPDRVLLKPSLVCPVYCRFCFRRAMVGHHAPPPMSPAQLDAAFAYIAQRPEIWEVIVSGGDPLALSPRRLADLVERLRPIEHVRVLRFHTRVPVVTPERITAELAEVLASAAQSTYVLVHANHQNELGVAARTACDLLLAKGITLLSQTVLLKGVNDNVDTLANLMRTFVEARIVPYYLHHPDLAPGSGHFRVSIAEGQRLMKALRGHYSGLCQPDYVIDLPGGYGKSIAAAPYVAQDPADPSRYEIEDFLGHRHRYEDN